MTKEDNSDIWSLDFTIAKLILPKLKKFRTNTAVYPANMTEKEWQEKLDKMIEAFEFAGSDKRWSAQDSEYDKHQEGIDLFAKHYWSLWY